MKLTSVEIHPESSSEVVVLSFRDPASVNKYNVKGITGLDADQIVPKYYGTSSGSKFYDLSLEDRNLVVRIGLNPDFASSQTYSDIRDELYRVISSSRTGRVQLQFKNTTDVVAAISGFISKFEAPQFEKTQEVQLTISCDEPLLKALTPVSVVVAGLNPALFGIIDNLSTAPHGLKMVASINANISSLIITQLGYPDVLFTITPVGGFLNGDVLHFSSEYKDRELYLVRGSATTQLADVIAAGSYWPTMFPGGNSYVFSHPTNVVLTSITYYPTYWGV